jgi:hypothetical protein
VEVEASVVSQGSSESLGPRHGAVHEIEVEMVKNGTNYKV